MMDKATCTTNCNCLLDGDSTHGDDDVVQVVHYSIQQTMDEQGLQTYSSAARWLLDEGLACWGVPERQQHRADAWRESCARELRGCIKGA